MPKTIILDVANTSPAIAPHLAVGGLNTDAAVSAVATVHAVPGAPTTADGGAGSIGAGTYAHRVSFVCAEGEEMAGPAGSAQTIAASHQLNLTNIPTGPAGVTARKIYRTPDGGITWGLVATIADNSTTTLTDNNASPGAAPPAAHLAYQFAVRFNGGSDPNNGAELLALFAGQGYGRQVTHRRDYPALDI